MDESNIPIDIHLKKLLDWLVSRRIQSKVDITITRICNRGWHEAIVGVREKIGGAIGDMPEHDKVKALLSGTSINYFHCLQIIDILKETEKDSKNFFGTYGSQRMKDWQEVAATYQRDNIFLAEAAQLLSQAVTYEIPGLKKQLAKTIQIQGDCDKKEKENSKKARDFRADYEKSCKQLKIEGGSKVRREIIALLDDLPQTYAKIAEDSRALLPAVEAYVAFLEATLDEAMFKKEDVLPALRFLVERGNVTTYEWMHGEAPLSIEEPKLDFGDEGAEDGGVDAIDFGEGSIDFGGGGGDQIDFGSTDDVDLDSGADIDWGNLGSSRDDAGGGEIDWSTADDATVEITVEDGGVSGGIARDSDALSLLDNRRTRTLILDELAELDCFMGQRLAELEAQDQGKFTVGGGAANLKEGSDKYSGHMSDIASIVSTLTAGQLHHLQLIRSSPSYVDRLVEGLKRKLTLVDRMELDNKAVGERREEAIGEQAVVQRKLDLIKGKTRELQSDIEADISKRYKNRPVNVMGGVQSV